MTNIVLKKLTNSGSVENNLLALSMPYIHFSTLLLYIVSRHF